MSINKETRPRPSSRAPRPFRLRNACNECHAAKLKCSGEREGCARCTKQSLQCVYSISKTGKVPGKRARNRSGDTAARSETPEGRSIPNAASSAHASVASGLPAAWPTNTAWIPGLDICNVTGPSGDAMEVMPWTSSSSTAPETQGSMGGMMYDATYTDAAALGGMSSVEATPSFMPTPPLSESWSTASSNTHHGGGSFDSAQLGNMPRSGMSRSSSVQYAHARHASMDHNTMLRSHSQHQIMMGVGGSLVAESPVCEPFLTHSRMTTPLDEATICNTLPPSPFSNPESDYQHSEASSSDDFDELRCIQGCCQVIESVQKSLKTRLRYFDLIVALIFKTLSTIEVLFALGSGSEETIRVSPQCMHLLFACMQQMVELLAVGHGALLEELQTMAALQGSDGALSGYKLEEYGADAVEKRKMKAQKAMKTLQDVRCRTLGILSRVKARSGLPFSQVTTEANVRNIQAGFQGLMQQYQQVAGN